MKKLFFILISIIVAININAQNWTIKQMKDKFGDNASGCYYMNTIAKGSFSNSAIIKDNLIVSFSYLGSFRLELLEYGSNLATFENGEFGVLDVKDQDGEVYHILVKQKNNYLEIEEKKYVDGLLALLHVSTNLKCYYEEKTEYSKSTYNFTINCIGFAKCAQRYIDVLRKKE